MIPERPDMKQIRENREARNVTSCPNYRPTNLRHQITLMETLESFRNGNRSELAGSYGRGSHKSFISISYFDKRPATFIIEVHRKEVLKTEDLTEAIRTYNSYP